MKFDYHTHHDRCGHAIGLIEDYILSAIKNNLHYIGIADHSPHFYHENDHPFVDKTMAKSQFPLYIDEILQLQEKYKEEIHVLVGVEGDFLPEHLDCYKKEFKKYPLDYIIGSVHQVNGISVFSEERWQHLTEEEINQTITKYYQLIEASAECGLYQIIGHMDVMKRTFPDFSAIHLSQLDKTLQTIAKNDISIEINTSGAQYDGVGWYPSLEILERANFYQIIPTFGSDAHSPDRVGDSFEQVQKQLKEIGFHEMAYFVNKQRFTISI